VQYPVQKACVKKLRRVRIRDIQLSAAKVSKPNFPQKSGNSPDISNGMSQPGMCRFESSQVSQAVRRSQVQAQPIAEAPANGGLSQFGRSSPDSQSHGLRPEMAEGLWPFVELFPFSGYPAGDGFDLYCAAELAL
jgi:hypothetical protein